MLVLPFLVSALGNRMRFIHVVRDPKEVVSGRNQKIYHDNCPRHYGFECSDQMRRRFQFWADANREQYEFAKKHLTSDSYLVVRTEDFVAGREACYRRLARFVHVDEKLSAESLERAITTTTSHAGSYFGTPLTAELKQRIFREQRLARQACKPGTSLSRYDLYETIRLFGYSVSDFSLPVPCEELPGAQST